MHRGGGLRDVFIVNRGHRVAPRNDEASSLIKVGLAAPTGSTL